MDQTTQKLEKKKKAKNLIFPKIFRVQKKDFLFAKNPEIN